MQQDDYRTVYRIEDDAGNGPFQSGCFFGGFHNGDDFRNPAQEPRLRRRWYRGDLDRYFCGFQSRDEARRWFPPRFLPSLDGFDLTTWRVPRRHVAFGRDQVMFDRARATLVDRRPVGELHSTG